jgi:hypothetical protein
MIIMSACSGRQTMKNITQIECFAVSGPVSPEFQWQESIIITAEKVTFSRSGSGTDSVINSGIWTIPVDTQKISELFSKLEAVDTSAIKRVEFEDPIDGGGYESYTISYDKNKTFSISNDTEGQTENADLIIEPINEFIQQLDFPK